MDIFNRVERLIGEDNLTKLKGSSVIVFGVGGVGGFVVEALARSGVGKIAVVDSDSVSETNINRQIIALKSNVGKKKVDVIEERVKEINPNITVEKFDTFYLPENADKIDLSKYDYVVDAVDTVTAKLEIVERAVKCNVKVISCMGTASKLDPLKVKVCDVFQTTNCPLARVMRRELKARKIERLKVVYSDEDSAIDKNPEIGEKKGKTVSPPSMIFVPAVAGLVIANEVIKDIIK